MSKDKGSNVVPECQYFNKIMLESTVIRVGEPVLIRSRNPPEEFKVIDIQMYGRQLLVWCRVGKRMIPFSDDEILGIDMRRKNGRSNVSKVRFIHKQDGSNKNKGL